MKFIVYFLGLFVAINLFILLPLYVMACFVCWEFIALEGAFVRYMTCIAVTTALIGATNLITEEDDKKQ